MYVKLKKITAVRLATTPTAYNICKYIYVFSHSHRYSYSSIDVHVCTVKVVNRLHLTSLLRVCAL